MGLSKSSYIAGEGCQRRPAVGGCGLSNRSNLSLMATLASRRRRQAELDVTNGRGRQLPRTQKMGVLMRMETRGACWGATTGPAGAFARRPRRGAISARHADSRAGLGAVILRPWPWHLEWPQWPETGSRCEALGSRWPQGLRGTRHGRRAAELEPGRAGQGRAGQGRDSLSVSPSQRRPA